MTDIVNFQNGLSLFAILVSCGALAVSFRASRQARKGAALNCRREAITHVENAIFEVIIDGNITTNTVASIRDALQISSLVFRPKTCGMLEQAHGIAFRLQHKSSDRMTDQDDNDKDRLGGLLLGIKKAMTKEARL
jgi:hypothetical protein